MVAAPPAPAPPAPRVDPYLRHAMPNAEWSHTLSDPVSRSFDAPRPAAEVIAVTTTRIPPKLLKRVTLIVVVLALAAVGWVQREAIVDAAQDGYDWIADRFADEPDGDEPN